MNHSMVRQLLEEAAETHRAGHLVAATRLYQKVLLTEPFQPEVWHLMGVIAGQQDDYDKAIERIQGAVNLQPNFPEAFCSLGNAYKAKGDLDQAEEAYRHSCSLDPRQAVAHNNLGC